MLQDFILHSFHFYNGKFHFLNGKFHIRNGKFHKFIKKSFFIGKFHNFVKFIIYLTQNNDIFKKLTSKNILILFKIFR